MAAERKRKMELKKCPSLVSLSLSFSRRRLYFLTNATIYRARGGEEKFSLKMAQKSDTIDR